jgi:hypothetical protein
MATESIKSIVARLLHKPESETFLLQVASAFGGKPQDRAKLESYIPEDQRNKPRARAIVLAGSMADQVKPAFDAASNVRKNIAARTAESVIAGFILKQVGAGADLPSAAKMAQSEYGKKSAFDVTAADTRSKIAALMKLTGDDVREDHPEHVRDLVAGFHNDLAKFAEAYKTLTAA